jgi:S1-C subfamily serine protease
MAYGDDPTATNTPVTGPPTGPPVGPPLSPPTTPPGYPTAPPAWNGSPGVPGSPPPWGPAPTPAPVPGRPSGRGKAALVALLLVAALIVGAGGGVAFTRVFGGSDAQTAAEPSTAPQAPSQPTQPSLPSSPRGGSDPFPGGSTGTPDFPSSGGSSSGGSSSGGSSSGETADSSAVSDKVVPGVVDINTLTSQGQGAGTGMVLTSSGQVLTNNHVVSGATRIVATDVDTGKRYEAKVVGTAPTEDVAVIQLVGAKDLGTVQTGDSSKVERGDAVVAIGNAGGKGGMPSVVTGNVVALGRDITASDPGGTDARQLQGLIQVDAPIEPGDSGGPLADADGKVIGINTAASTDGQGSSTGEGYAVPINKALDVAKQIESGRSSDTVNIGVKGVLGVQVVPASASASSGQGASVAGVADRSGAANAGVTEGSTITSLDGKRITSAEDLTSAVAGRKPGQKVKLGWTDATGASRTATVTLTEGPPD